MPELNRKKESTTIPTTRANENSWRSLLLSFSFHLVLVTLLLAFWTNTKIAGSTEGTRTAGIVLTDAKQLDNEKKYLDETEVALDQDTLTGENAKGAATSAAPNLPTRAVNHPLLPGQMSDVEALDVSNMTNVPSKTNGTQGQLSDANKELIAQDQKYFESIKPAGPPTSISVFGSGKMTGRSFLFLLDRSKSMGGGGLGVIQAARTELSQAINQLEDYHQFQVVGYHDQTFPMQARRLLTASDSNKAKVPKFIANMAAFGATNHFNGLISAISFKPDVIILLTDGGLPELTRQQLKTIQRNAGNTQIHCIQFGFGGNQRDDNFMVELANQNNGTFRYVDVNEWDDE